nr:hypothetical protein CFP56_79595 [Quercus suber]
MYGTISLSIQYLRARAPRQASPTSGQIVLLIAELSDDPRKNTIFEAFPVLTGGKLQHIYILQLAPSGGGADCNVHAVLLENRSLSTNHTRYYSTMPDPGPSTVTFVSSQGL